MQELRLTEPMVLCSVLKWCWSRLPGGVVTWEAYELFKVGEQDSHLARDAFATFIPISVDSDARAKIIFDFFELLAAVAAHAKSNGLGGRKLSRYAGWWAFEQVEASNGFEASYKNWNVAADATSHLFFAYLRSISPDSPHGISGIASLPLALQTLVQAMEYPPETPTLLHVSTTKVVMIVDTVSPTPFALLRRAKNFEYRDSDSHLQEFAASEDPVRTLTDECLRVLRCISSTNQSSVSSSKTSTSLRDASWSRFEDIGFGGAIESDVDDEIEAARLGRLKPDSLWPIPQSFGGNLGRPTTPSWADFLSTGFDENGRNATPLLLPPDKILPPIETVRGQSSQSYKRIMDTESVTDPGELASIANFDLDECFWWVWISSLASEEPASRKAVFGRCALLETIIRGAKWLVLEEQVKGAAPESARDAYIAEKKRFFSFSAHRNKLSRRKSSVKTQSAVKDSYKRPNNQAPQSKTSIAPDQHARIQAAATALQRKHREEQEMAAQRLTKDRDDSDSTKTNSVMTLQPTIMNEASQALKWASNYDKNAYRAAYLSDSRAGTGAAAQSQKLDEPSPPPTTSKPPSPPEKETSPASSPQSSSQEDRCNSTTEVLNSVQTSLICKDEPTAAAAPLASDSLPKQSIEATGNAEKKQDRKPANSGFKSVFGSNKKNIEEKPTMKPKGAEISAVAAARALLESRAKAAQQSGNLASQNSLSASSGPALERKAAPASSATSESAERYMPVATSAAYSVTQPATEPPTLQEKRAPLLPHNGPPQTRHAIEEDSLSRVGTNERAAADREFSKFDQGPLVEQPAFVPEDFPVSDTISNDDEVPEARDLTEPSSKSDQASKVEPTTMPSFDRWAQIRRNAAERAATHADEAGSRLSQTDRTDDGDTSGEETIESRVARIKARVAELTGNMDGMR